MLKICTCIVFKMDGAFRMKQLEFDLNLIIARQDTSIMNVTTYGLDGWVFISGRDRDISVCHF
jgi:hypothetical protein